MTCERFVTANQETGKLRDALISANGRASITASQRNLINKRLHWLKAIIRRRNSRPNLRTKKYCSLINFGLHHYQPTQWLLTDSTHLSQHLYTYIHIVCLVCCFYLLFQLRIICYPALEPQGCYKTDWLIDWWIHDAQCKNLIRRRTHLGLSRD